MNIYVKFCGGCNPRFDRAGLLSRMERAFPEHVFENEYKDPEVSLIICGCSAACADRRDAAAPYGIYTVWQEDCLEDFGDFITSVRVGLGE
ncbi:MAG: hypothetical protein ACOX75_04250 [Lachnospiraceae bacterium]|jgi:hypothetical protein